MSDPARRKLVWPPMKDDLERLYLVEKLSAAKIAKVYRLKYKNPKVAESTILYHLKRNGIERRDATEHLRKVTPEMVDEWVARYQSGESLKRIAGAEVSPVTVFMHLRKRGVELRDKVEAQIKAVTKYERKPFRGDAVEKAYLMGLRYGDFHVVKHGRAVRVRVSTTHPAMAKLFDSLFSPFGEVHRYPREAKLTGFEWNLECDLDSSFSFLLQKINLAYLEGLPKDELVAFLSGLFDAEGTIYLHNKRGRFNPEAFFSNTDRPLVELVARSIDRLGLHRRVRWVDQDCDRQGVQGQSKIGRVGLWRFEEVKRLLQILRLRHPEKVAKSRLVLLMEYRSNGESYLRLIRGWENLIANIKRDRDVFIESARLALASRNIS